MATPISFTPVLDWVDASDPNNLPVDIRILKAADLLRYEAFGRDATARINTHDTQISNNTTAISDLNTALGTTDQNVSDLESTVSGHTTTISTLGTDVTNLKKLRAVTTKTASYTVAATDSVIITNSASALTVTLPSAATMTAGKVFTVKNAGAGVATIASAAGKIDGATTKTLAQWAGATVISNGTDWFVI